MSCLILRSQQLTEHYVGWGGSSPPTPKNFMETRGEEEGEEGRGLEEGEGRCALQSAEICHCPWAHIGVVIEQHNNLDPLDIDAHEFLSLFKQPKLISPQTLQRR